MEPTEGQSDPNQPQPSTRAHITGYPPVFEQSSWTVQTVMQAQGDIIVGNETAIDWDAVDHMCMTHLERARIQFIEHMRNFAGAQTEQDAIDRYIDLRLQETQYQKVKDNEVSSLRIGTWSELVKYTNPVFVLGESGSGKTTLMLNVARQLAEQALKDQAAPLPIYVSLRTYAGGGADTLLAMAADASGVEQRILRALWREQRRPLCLLLDNVDEILDQRLRNQLIGALDGLWKTNAPLSHSLVVAGRPGPLQDAIQTSTIKFYRLVLMSLDDREMDSLLQRYGALDLLPVLDAYLREVVQNPDLLSALAQSIHDISRAEVPRNAGQIYRLLVDYQLFRNDNGAYDYWRVKRLVLAELAFTMLTQNQSFLIRDDALLDRIVILIEQLQQRYSRRLKIMPDDWSAHELLDELIESAVLDQIPGHVDQLVFTKQGYLAYFAAVYLATKGVDSDQIQEIMPTLDPNRWMQPLIILIGSVPEAAILFDRLYNPDPQMAAQLWFEARPYNVPAPTIITEAFNRQAAALTASPLLRLDEPFTARMLVRMLNSAHPQQRLQATHALTQWGLDAVDSLLDAAEDDLALIRATAMYALLHLGESTPQHDANRPVPPLLHIDGQEFTFNSYGGCNARIGPLNLIQMPDPSTVELRLTIKNLDFDLFSADAAFALAHTSPQALATDLFNARNQVDWLDLAVRCQMIAEHSAAIAKKVERRTLLASLGSELRRREARFAGLGLLLARDLGVPWRLPPPPDSVVADTRDIYDQLRRFYNRTNQSRIFELSAPRESSGVTTSQHVQQNFGTMLAIKINSVQFPEAVADAQTGSVRSLRFQQQVERVTGGTVTGVAIDVMQGSGSKIQPLFHIDGQINVDNAADGSHIDGLRIHRLIGDVSGWKATLQINIAHIAASFVSGVVVDEHELSEGTPRQPVHMLVIASQNSDPTPRTDLAADHANDPTPKNGEPRP